eukprot:Unigene10475_Nuclearia_a/m.32015 Unigene10475_Nuclearia_a/g.32015  ORF Unigene10475_Nuclearia_a/g.32015 Unigene10475_Nuclearia_a/m.32015 type:complete len:326 (+) Unigene10475_Nuclearia_a:4247-5224(+)
MYESPEDKEPTFDAKGIETVRRDTCPAVSKTLERTIKMLFRTQDLSEIKAYLQRQWVKILNGRVSVQDFVFSKEVRLGTYSNRGPLPPSALVATHRMSTDPRAEPRFGERVRYVVVYGGPQSRLMDLVVPPEQLLRDKSLRLHGTYYITKQIIPAVARVLNMVGADLMAWFAELPRVHRAAVRPGEGAAEGSKAVGSSSNGVAYDAKGWPIAQGRARGNVRGVKTIDAFYQSSHCQICRTATNDVLCEECLAKPQQTTLTAIVLLRDAQRAMAHLARVCRNCMGVSDAVIPCVSLDCPIYYERLRATRALERLEPLQEALRALNA